jgi:hypothetical protein
MRSIQVLIYVSLILSVPAFGGELQRSTKAKDDAKAPRLTACADVGEGYFRVGDSSTCVKVSGYVQADFVYRGGRSK